jgi:hypothetical protein
MTPESSPGLYKPNPKQNPAISNGSVIEQLKFPLHLTRK